MFCTCAARFGCAVTTAKGVTIYMGSIYYQVGWVFKAETGSILLGISLLDCDKNRVSGTTWEERRPGNSGKLERRKQGLEERDRRR